jgi:hypothetical protein
MKNKLMIAVLIGMGWVSASHAVIITWAAETTGSVVGSFTTAQLVYVAGGTWDSGYTSVDTASGIGVDATAGVVYDNLATDTKRNAGAYFVVLFNSGNNAVYRSVQSLAWDNASYNAFVEDGMNPARGLFLASGDQTTGWVAVPEPNTFALLALGAAALAARRRRKL